MLRSDRLLIRMITDRSQVVLVRIFVLGFLCSRFLGFTCDLGLDHTWLFGFGGNGLGL